MPLALLNIFSPYIGFTWLNGVGFAGHPVSRPSVCVCSQFVGTRNSSNPLQVGSSWIGDFKQAD